jgi:hypothetical protein
MPKLRPRWTRLARPCLAAAVAVLAVVGPAQARAQTVRTQIHIPLTVLTNLCADAEPVALSGDEYITTKTKPTRNGGYTVSASIVAPNLRGTGLVSNVPYRGVDGQRTFSYFAPPPFPATYDVTLYTVLKPQYKLPSMYLVTVIRQTIAFDGTPITTFRSVSLTCKQPTCSARRSSEELGQREGAVRARRH